MGLLTKLFGSEEDEQTDEKVDEPTYEQGEPRGKWVDSEFIDAEKYDEFSRRVRGCHVLEEPKIGYKYFSDELVGRIVIPKGATVVQTGSNISGKLRTDNVYIDKLFNVDTTFKEKYHLKNYPTKEVIREANVETAIGKYSYYPYKVGKRYVVSSLNKDHFKPCNADGIYFCPNIEEAIRGV
jgi:hypothetical protein